MTQNKQLVQKQKLKGAVLFPSHQSIIYIVIRLGYSPGHCYSPGYWSCRRTNPFLNCGKGGSFVSFVLIIAIYRFLVYTTNNVIVEYRSYTNDRCMNAEAETNKDLCLFLSLL